MPADLGPWLHRLPARSDRATPEQPARDSRVHETPAPENPGSLPAGTSPISTPEPEPAVRLFCFPHAGGAATSFAPLALALAPEAEVLAVQYPGRRERFTERCVEELDVLADLAAAELGPQIDRPFALFGHSMGATLAFEVARRLERAGAAPLALFASGQRAPMLQTGPPAVRLDDDALLANIRTLGETDPRLLDNPGFLGMIWPAIRADYNAVHMYRFQEGPKLNCPITALVGESDPKVAAQDARLWSKHTESWFDLREFPGGHFYLNQQIDGVAQCVKQVAAQVLADESAPA